MKSLGVRFPPFPSLILRIVLIAAQLFTGAGAYALAPKSDLAQVLGAVSLEESKPKIVQLLMDKPNPDGPFAKGDFSTITEVLVDLRPKEANGIGDQLLYTPMLLACERRLEPGLKVAM